MAAISGTFNLCDPRSRLDSDNLQRLDVLAAACRWLDTRIITLCTGTRDPRRHVEMASGQRAAKRPGRCLVESMREAVKIADRHEVTLAFEPEINNVVNSVMQGAKAAR